MIRRYYKIIKLFGLRLKTQKILNLMVYQSMMIDIKTKIRRYDDKLYTNFRDLNVSENDKECESFTVTSIDSIFVYENGYYLQV